MNITGVKEEMKRLAVGFCARRHDLAAVNGLTGQLPFSCPHANPMEQSPKQLPQKLPILKCTRHAKLNAAISLECLKNVTAV